MENAKTVPTTLAEKDINRIVIIMGHISRQLLMINLNALKKRRLDYDNKRRS